MKRVMGVLLALLLPATFLVACGGDDAADSTTTTSKTSAEKSGSDSGSSGSDSGSSDSGSGSSTGNEKIDKFCDDAKALAEKFKKAVEDRDTDLAKEAADDAKDLAAQGRSLAGEVLKDPSLAKPLTDCSAELSDAVSGAGGG